MPTYEYLCKSCGEHTEAVQAFTDDPLTVCPNCGGTLRKVFGNIGISFKGSGFYKNDSRSPAGAGKTTAPAESSGGAPSSNGNATTGSATAEKSASGDSSSASSNGGPSTSTGSSSKPSSPAKT